MGFNGDLMGFYGDLMGFYSDLMEFNQLISTINGENHDFHGILL